MFWKVNNLAPDKHTVHIIIVSLLSGKNIKQNLAHHKKLAPLNHIGVQKRIKHQVKSINSTAHRTLLCHNALQCVPQATINDIHPCLHSIRGVSVGNAVAGPVLFCSSSHACHLGMLQHDIIILSPCVLHRVPESTELWGTSQESTECRYSAHDEHKLPWLTRSFSSSSATLWKEHGPMLYLRPANMRRSAGVCHVRS